MHSLAEILYKVYQQMLKQRDVIASTIDNEYTKLRDCRTIMSADQWCIEMISLYKKGVKYHAHFASKLPPSILLCIQPTPSDAIGGHTSDSLVKDAFLKDVIHNLKDYAFSSEITMK
jgi:hypothetical protein